MKKQFRELQKYVKLHDGYHKPQINFKEMYELFPNFEFTPQAWHGRYENWGKGFCNKDLSMIVSDGKDECYLTYKEYMDAPENLAFLS